MVRSTWASRGRTQKALEKKVVLGDNLSSHLSPLTLRRAAEIGFSFRLLPPNTTHFCQPLDVAFFGPLKKAWKLQLMEYKRSIRLINTVKPEWVVGGFRACGLVPFDPEGATCRMQAHRNQQPDDRDEAVLVAALQINQEKRISPARQVKGHLSTLSWGH